MPEPESDELQRASSPALGGSPKAPEFETAWGRRGRTVVVHGTLLVLFLVALRIDKIVVLRLQPSFGQWASVLLSEVGLALLLQSAWMLTVRVRHRLLSRLWLPAYVVFHVPIYLLVVTGQRFFYETLSSQKLSMVIYAIREFSTVQGVISVGLDRSFFVLCALAVACLGVAVAVYFWQRAWRVGQSVLIPAVLTLVGACFVMWPSPTDIVIGPLSGNFLTDLLPNPAIQQYLDRMVPTWRLYEPPQLVPAGASTEAPPSEPGPERPAEPAPPRRPPNVLLVILESTRSDLLTAYGGATSKMPFVDSLAKEAVVVDAAYTSVSHTTKALVGILCGMYPLIAMKLVEAEPGMLPLRCLPALLADAGYETAFFQSAGNFEHRRDLTANMKFQTSFVPTRRDAEGHAQSGYLGWEEGVMVEPVVSWVTSRTKPYFATILSLSTHHPYQSPSGGRPRDMAEARGYYDEAATYVDGVLRDLFGRLEAAGALDDTVVIVTGDHGEAFGTRTAYRQHDLVPYEEVTRVPLLLRHPVRLGAPRRLGGLRHHVDILPTVLELAGQRWEGTVPGHSLLSSEGHEWVVTSCWFSTYCLSLRRQNLSYVFQFGRVPLQIYDVEKDPAQQHDLAAMLDPNLGENAINAMLGTQASVHLYYRSQFDGVSLE